ncbi:MAG TPA: hypothetical protein PLH19_08860 [Anaerolineae bacterium]|nr:hypothetical protein [Anaerolineae bacterium]HQH38625.1 hypothetical protein [Anaerolineae bacterium]
MADQDKTITIGNVLRADIRGFVVASHIPAPDVPTFGTFVRAAIQQERAELIGLVYNITLQDDPFLKNLAVTVVEDDPRYAEIIRDQQENRAIPVEIAVVAIGYRNNEGYHYGLPPQPPMILHRITVCSQDEVRHITAAPDFLHTLLDNRDVPADELIPTALQQAAHLLPETLREDFYLDAGRYLAHYWGRDPARLERILRRLA